MRCLGSYWINNNMRTRVAISVVFTLAVIALILWSRKRIENAKNFIPSREMSVHDWELSNRVQYAVAATQSTNWTSPIRNDPDSNYTRWYILESAKDPRIDWKSPMSFFGLVLDEQNQPVQEVVIDMIWTDLSAQGNSQERCFSDGNGKFALLNRRGKTLCMRLSRTGYYVAGGGQNCYEYASPWEGNRFYPDSNNPVIFRLKKAGKIEPLIGYSVSLPVSNESRPTDYDLLTGKWIEPGSIQFECQIGPEAAAQRRFDWKFSLRVPGGGILERTNRLDFEAPAEGYVESVSFSKRAQDEDWQNGVSGMYFVKFGGKPFFGRIEFDFHPSRLSRDRTSSVSLKYWVNPSGSTNLEADPTKVPREVPKAYLRTGIPEQ